MVRHRVLAGMALAVDTDGAGVMVSENIYVCFLNDSKFTELRTSKAQGFLSRFRRVPKGEFCTYSTIA